MGYGLWVTRGNFLLFIVYYLLKSKKVDLFIR